MRFLDGIALPVLALASAVTAASSWSFEDATLTVQGKGAGVGGSVKEKYVTALLAYTLCACADMLTGFPKHRPWPPPSPCRPPIP